MMYIFGVLVNSYTLKHMSEVLAATKVLVCSPSVTHQVQESYAWLTSEVSKLGGLELDSDEEEEVQEQHHPLDIQERDGEEVVDESSTSPFLTYFVTQLDKITAIPAESGASRNPLHAPVIIDMLMRKWVPTAPFWSNLLLGRLICA